MMPLLAGLLEAQNPSSREPKGTPFLPGIHLMRGAERQRLYMARRLGLLPPYARPPHKKRFLLRRLPRQRPGPKSMPLDQLSESGLRTRRWRGDPLVRCR